MKTFLLALSACTLAALTSYGQTSQPDSVVVSPLKPLAGKLATELNVNPFNGTISLNNSLNQLKFRYFAKTDLALRLGFNGSKDSRRLESSNAYGTNAYDNKDERSSSTIGVNAGIEKHFKGTRRLSPYIGADLVLEKRTSEQEITSGNSTTTITGAWRESSYSSGYPSQTYYTFMQQGYSRYGLNLVTGFDFYMAKNLFFGYEASFGFSKRSMDDIEVKQSDSSNSPSNSADVTNTSFSFGPSLMNGVRIGYVF
ncbi:hypothetical protein [Pontibacter mangrovi]|uniref:Outer membrane protein beta-barrel domain-containing protein n=1 Tax=Pontibacter mangrovi TaxID=2589816 RepID=A0A501W6I1_9BACT|nr:hypothetical protein [Pontibacter mangrovi]TPE44898.1 hypothetical protein FJM65_07730 [Pontibacter mangrovi]